MYEIRESHVSPAPEIGLGKGWIERAGSNPDGSRLAVGLGKTLFILGRDREITTSFRNDKTSVADISWNQGIRAKSRPHPALGEQMKRLGEAEPFARFDWDGASLIVTWSPDGRWVATGDLTTERPPL